jgi:hypothetical protein
MALLRGGQAELGVEQNGGGVLGQDIGDQRLELLEVVGEASPPRSLASDFCSEPRWSMAAAAITPRASETDLRPASFPGVSFMGVVVS